jgi:cell division septal protein FtsQ
MTFFSSRKTASLSDTLAPRRVIRRKRNFSRVKPFVRREKKTRLSTGENVSTMLGGKFWWYPFLWMAFVGVTVYAVFFSPFLRIEKVTFQGMNAVSREELDDFLRARLSEKALWFIPRDTLTLFPVEASIRDMRDRFAVFRSVTITKVFPHELIVRVEERLTTAVWCAQNRCSLLDERGFAYTDVRDAAALVAESASLVHIIDEGARPSNENAPVTSATFARFALEIRGRLRQELGIETNAEALSPSRFANELTLRTREGWALRFNTDFPIEKTLETLRLVLKKEIAADRREKLRYIDLRVESRAYYSVEGEHTPEDSKEAILSNLPKTENAPDSRKKSQ